LLIKQGAFDVKNSPIDKYASTIAKILVRSRSIAGFTFSAMATVGSVYTMDCVLRDAGLEPLFIPLLRKLIPSPSSLNYESTTANDREHKLLIDQ
jgi:hypothetical protein